MSTVGRYRKSDVRFHAEAYGVGHAAVNVKDRSSYAENLQAIAQALEDQGMTLSASTTLEGLADAISEHQGSSDWDPAAESCWGMAADEAQEIFGKGYGVYSEGRMGGWCVVSYNGRTCFDEDEVAGWDAIELARWARFERSVRAIADDYPYQLASIYLLNYAEVGADVESLQAAGVGL